VAAWRHEDDHQKRPAGERLQRRDLTGEPPVPREDRDLTEKEDEPTDRATVRYGLGGEFEPIGGIQFSMEAPQGSPESRTGMLITSVIGASIAAGVFAAIGVVVSFPGWAVLMMAALAFALVILLYIGIDNKK
jgi:hypothetical protein